MKLGVMQPYFFPHIEYFRLIAECDLWIGFDTVKYNKKSWMSRNRILNRDKGWSYFGVPVSRQNSRAKISSTALVNSTDWRRDIFNKLKIYKNDAPYHAETLDFLRKIFRIDHNSLSNLNMFAIQNVCDFLGIKTKIASLSELSLDQECRQPERRAESR